MSNSRRASLNISGRSCPLFCSQCFRNLDKSGRRNSTAPGSQDSHVHLHCRREQTIQTTQELETHTVQISSKLGIHSTAYNDSAAIVTASASTIFENDIIFKNILKYLRTPDLKILRQTCKWISSRVNDYRSFSKNLRITISDEAMRENVISKTTFQWNKAKIIFDIKASADFASIRKCLEWVEDLELESLRPELPKCHQAIFELIPQLDHLKYLTFDMEFLNHNIPMSILGGTLKVLERLSLSRNHMTVAGAHELANYLKNLYTITSLGLKLTTFEVDEGIKDMTTSSPEPPFQGILRSCANTLETIKAKCFQHLGDIELMVFPSLKNIQFKLNIAEDGAKFAEFLNNQPELESIQLTLNAGIIPPIVLEAIRMKSSQLHTLLLEGGGWLESFPTHDCWTFLRNLKKLEKITITGGELFAIGLNCENVVDVCLQHLTPLKMKSIQLEHWKSSQGLNWESKTISTLTGFSHLIQLKLRRCKNVLNDNILQFMFGKLTRLQVFHFGGSDEITDCGLTGERNGENFGVPISNLSGLQELQIYNCPNVSLEGLTKSVQFQELRIADLRCGAQVCMPEHILLTIAKNNPSLEIVKRLVEYWPSSCAFDSVLSVNPRVTRVFSYSMPPFIAPLKKRSGQDDKVSQRPSYGVISSSDENVQLGQLRPIRMFRNKNNLDGYYFL